MKLKWKPISLSNLYVFLLILVSCWEVIMPSSFFDEILLIGMLVYIGVKKCFLSRKMSLIITLFLTWSLIGILLSFHASGYSLFILIDSIKPLLMLVTFLAIRIDENYFKRIVEYYCIINIPSAIVGIINGVFYNYLGRELLIDSGSLKYIDGVLVERAGGLVFVSGVFSDICAMLFVCVLFMYKWDIKKIILLSLYLVGLLFGRGRFPLLLMATGVSWYLWVKLHNKYRKFLLFVIIGIMTIATGPLVKYILTEYAFDFENQVRFVPYSMLFIIPEQILFFGAGMGIVGSTDSYLYAADLYSKYGVDSSKGLDWEAQLGKLLVQTGVVGTVLWFYPFVCGLINAFKSKSIYRNVCIFIIGYYLINLTMNKSYEVQILVLVCSAISLVSKRKL